MFYLGPPAVKGPEAAEGCGRPGLDSTRQRQHQV